MGFGLLFFGYFMVHLMSINQIGAFAEIIGYVIIFISSVKLNRYNSSFKWMMLASVIMIAVSGAVAASNVSQFLYEQLIIDSQPFGDTYRNIVGYVELAVVFIFHTAMLSAIRSIAIETGEIKNAMVALRNLVVVCVYFVLYLLATTIPSISKYCLIAAVIVYFFFVVFNLALIYSCYARICDEGDVDMEQRPSRFAFVNKMREESEQRRLQSTAKRQNKRKKGDN